MGADNEVGTCYAGFVGVVKHNAAVSNVRWTSRIERQVRVSEATITLDMEWA